MWKITSGALLSFGFGALLALILTQAASHSAIYSIMSNVYKQESNNEESIIYTRKSTILGSNIDSKQRNDQYLRQENFDERTFN